MNIHTQRMPLLIRDSNHAVLTPRPLVSAGFVRVCDPKINVVFHFPLVRKTQLQEIKIEIELRGRKVDFLTSLIT